jgi:hypothetical protein
MKFSARLLIVLLALACSGAPTDISVENAALGAALAKAGVLSARGGGYGAYALSQLFKHDKLTLVSDSTGATVPFDAVAVLIVWDMRASQGELEAGWYNGVIAWNGLNVADQTVDHMTTVGAAGSGTASYSTVTAEMNQLSGNFIGEAVVYLQANETVYTATSGTYTANTATFGSPKGCARPTDAAPPPITCVISTGRMTGSFNFVAHSGVGGAALTQPSVTYSLPAIQVIISG